MSRDCAQQEALCNTSLVEDCWLAMSLYAINWLAGFPGLAQGQPLANGQEAVKHLKRQVAGFLSRAPILQ